MGRVTDGLDQAVESVLGRPQKAQSTSGFFRMTPVDMDYTIVIRGGSEGIHG
jgi:hypothetical protein